MISFWIFHSLIVYITVLLINISVIFLSIHFNWPIYLKLASVVVFIIIIIILPIEIVYLRYVKHKLFNYVYDNKLVKIEYGGILFKKYIVIPTAKIYSIDIYQGPLLKKYDLYNINLITMANTHEIEGIELDEAKNIQKNLNSIKGE